MAGRIRQVFGNLRTAVTAGVRGATVHRSDGMSDLWETVQGTDLFGDTTARNAYEKSLYAHAAIENIATSLGGLGPRLYTMNDEPIFDPSHEYVRLLNQPNPEQSIDEFITATCVHREIDGIVHWVEPEWMPARRPRERAIYVASRSEMEPLNPGGVLRGWRYVPWDTSRVQTLRLDQVTTLRHYHPRRRLDGLAPATVARLAIDSHYYASLCNMSALKNGTELGPVFSADQVMSEQQHADALKIINLRHAGPRNAKRAIFMSGGVKVDRGTQGMKDLDWLEGKRLSAKEIAAIYNVPPIYVGLFDEAHLSNSKVQELLFWTQNGLPQKRRLVQALMRMLLRGDRARYYIDLDTSGIQALKDQEAEFMETTFGLTKFGLSRNEINRRFDHGFEEPSYGEVPLAPAGQIPIDVLVDEARAAMIGETVPEGTPAEDAKSATTVAVSGLGRMNDAVHRANQAVAAIGEIIEGEKNSATEQALHKKWRRSWLGLLRVAQLRINRLFDRQRKEMKRRLVGVELPYPLPIHGKTPARLTYQVRSAFDDIINFILFSPKEEDGKLTATLRPAIGDGLELGGKQIANEVGGDFEFNLDAPDVAVHLEEQAIRVRAVNHTTAEHIRETLREGLKDGETLAELGKRIDAVMGTEATGKPGRGYTIANTEMHEALSAGRDEGMRQAGVEGKKWLSSGGPTVRSSHRFAEHETRVAPIPLDEKFALTVTEGSDSGLTEFARYPGDNTLSARNRINCSCVSLPAMLKDGKRAAASVTERVGNYTYEDLLRERE